MLYPLDHFSNLLLKMYSQTLVHTQEHTLRKQTIKYKYAKMDQIYWLGFSREKNRTVYSTSIIWGNNHHFHLAISQ